MEIRRPGGDTINRNEEANMFPDTWDLLLMAARGWSTAKFEGFPTRSYVFRGVTRKK